ncbi:hypothetical protein [Mycobacterium colombiense]|uniref:hypothetical protein n=1 Tax=Mycobacterium colombiense TaxID=339268 RepID=UPI001150A92E|nr:hypothetical protein [Mycobacterium colombiense]
MAYSTTPGIRDVLSRNDIESLTAMERKIYENRLRRVADRRGYRLEKSRRRDERAITFGLYRLVDLLTGDIIGAGLLDHAPGGFGLELSDVAANLFEDQG